ncbi:unnamed protein product [Mytilus edulis]|uniref:C-type lectin domain-containing protein n=1 Tax=Mytilus edulis TaxID=6550 RepID=A0A8S3RBG2_MYTED|nr:unnamed protein product [Mytilus edulis]
MCLSNPQCCVASYSKVTSTCRIDNSERCCDENEFHDGWTYLQRNSYLTMTCRGCISFNNSLYLISEEHLDWSKAKANCECRGSELAKLETFEENEFIKREVKTRNTGVSGYWIGGYDFYNDNVMEWIGQPDQSMSFSDFQPNEPDAPNDQLCMVLWGDYDFRWGDADCHVQLSYICEFMQR